MRYILFSGLLALIFACGTSKSVEWGEDHFDVRKSYRQDQIPGEEDAEVRVMLYSELENVADGISFDSIEYLNKSAQCVLRENILKVNMTDGFERGYLDSTSEEEAILYYHLNETNYRFKLILEREEDLVMP